MLPIFVLITFSFLVAQGCATKPPNSNTVAPSAGKKIDIGAAEQAAILNRYSYFELQAVSELIGSLAKEDHQAEGETNIGCRIDPKVAVVWYPKMLGLIEERALEERKIYQENPQVYQRTRGVDQCVSKCTCSALEKIVKAVPVKFFRGPEARTTHREILRRLALKNARQKPEELQVCAEQQRWFCSSELRSFLDSDILLSP